MTDYEEFDDETEDNSEETETVEEASEPTAAEETWTKRVFKTGATTIQESANMQGKTNDEVKKLLVPLYPEIANATMRETVTKTDTGDVLTVEFLPQPGRKG